MNKMSSIDNLNAFKNSLNRRTSNDILRLVELVIPTLNEFNDRLTKLELLFQDTEPDKKEELQEIKIIPSQPTDNVASRSTDLQPIQEQPKPAVEVLSSKPDNVDSSPVGYTTVDIEEELEKTLSERDKHNADRFKSILRSDAETKKKVQKLINSSKKSQKNKNPSLD